MLDIVNQMYPDLLVSLSWVSTFAQVLEDIIGIHATELFDLCVSPKSVAILGIQIHSLGVVAWDKESELVDRSRAKGVELSLVGAPNHALLGLR